MIALSLLLLTQTAPIDQYLSRGDYPAALKAAQALPAEAKTRYEGLIALRQGRSHAAGEGILQSFATGSRSRTASPLFG